MHTTDVLSTAEAAELAGVDRSTITRWVAAGRITPILRGPTGNGAMFFRRNDIASLTREAAS